MRKGHFFLDDQSIPSRRVKLMHSQFRDAVVRGPTQHVPLALQLAGDAAQVVFSVSEWKQCVAHENRTLRSVFPSGDCRQNRYDRVVTKVSIEEVSQTGFAHGANRLPLRAKSSAAITYSPDGSLKLVAVGWGCP